MNIRTTAATAARVLAQLWRHPRAILFILLIPALLLAATYYLFENEPAVPGQPRAFDRVGLQALAIVPFGVMFVATSLSLLHERTSGALERLLTTPIHKADLVCGYAASFSVAGALQSVAAYAVARWFFGLSLKGGPGLVLPAVVANAVLGVCLGLFCAAIARTQFQAALILSIVGVPQLLLCGLFVARDRMNSILRAVSNVLPLTFSVDAVQEGGWNAEPTGRLWSDLLATGIAALAALLFAALLLRRRTA